MQKKVALLISISVFLSIIINAQDKPGTELTVAKSAFIHYNNATATNTNLILNDLSKSISEEPEDIKLKLNFNLVISTHPISTGAQICVQLLDIKFDDNILYKGFNVTTLLKPSEVQLNLELLNENNDKLAEIKTKAVNIIKNYSKKALANYDGFEEFTSKNVHVTNYAFKYDERTTNVFRQRIQLIDEYYDFSALINLENRKLDDINLKDIDKLVSYRDKIRETNKFLKKLDNKNFKSKLNLTNNDPALFGQNLKKIKERAYELEKNINYALQNMHITYFEKGVSYLNENDSANAKYYFLKSIEVKANYAPPHIHIANFLNNTGKKDSSIYVIINVINSMGPTPEMMQKCIEISRKIADDFQSKAEYHNHLKQYKKALPFLYATSNICSHVSKSICDEKLYNLYTTTHTGIFNEIISNINDHTKNTDFVEAEKMIDSAVVYKNINNYYIASKNKVIPLITRLFDNVMYTADSLYDTGSFPEANKQYNYAEKLCKKFVVVACKNEIYDGLQMTNQGIYDSKIDSIKLLYDQKNYDETENLINKLKIRQLKYRLVENSELIKYEKLVFEKKYLKLIKEAKKLIFSKKYTEALELLIESNILQQKFELTKYNEFDSLYYNSAEQAVHIELKKGKRRAAGNRINEAKRHYSIANSMLEKYNIEKSELLTITFEELKSIIFSQKCKTAQLDYDVQLNTATRFIGEGKYIEANNALMKAVRISDENSECQILTKDAINKRDGIWNIVCFQKKRIKINELLVAGNNQDAIVKYIELEKFYKDSSIFERSRLTLESLNDFILNNTENLINYAVKHYANNNQLDIALRYLHVLFEKNYPTKWTEINQNLLGNLLAVRDNKMEQIDDPKTFVQKYTDGEKWFRYLEKAYVKQFKELGL